eukprot:5637631-Prymnesium_polylepis.1
MYLRGKPCAEKRRCARPTAPSGRARIASRITSTIAARSDGHVGSRGSRGVTRGHAGSRGATWGHVGP